jgi:phosphohistidine phosphatase
MPKQLLIMRHAKSSWEDSGISDFERTLNRRGLKDAPRMAQFIAAQDCAPDLIASSSATRAKLTAELFVENCEGVEAEQLVLVEDFYHAPPRIYFEYLSKITDEEVETVMVIGHNPGLAEMVYRLSHSHETMPTAAIAHFHFDIEKWNEISNLAGAKLVNVWRPKELDW